MLDRTLILARMSDDVSRTLRRQFCGYCCLIGLLFGALATSFCFLRGAQHVISFVGKNLGSVAVGVLATSAAVASAVAAISSCRVAHSASRRDLLDLARSLHVDLTTGEVADARNRLGTIAHSCKPKAFVKKNSNLYRQAWFVELWCFERIRNALLVFDELHKEGKDAKSSLLKLIAVQTSFINKEAVTVRSELVKAGGALSDDKSKQALIDVIGELHHGMVKVWVDPPEQIRSDSAPGCGTWADG